MTPVSLAGVTSLFGLCLKRTGCIAKLLSNNTLHASRQLCAPWGVSFFRSPIVGGSDA